MINNKKNLFLFNSDENFIEAVDCLLKFIRHPIPLDEFFNTIPNHILNAKLDKLEFKYQNQNFIIELKNKNNTVITNTYLGPLGLTIADIADKLEDNKIMDPELTLKNSLEKIIIFHDRKQIKFTINTIIQNLEKFHLSMEENKNNQVNIRFFFIFLKILFQQSPLSKDKLSGKSILNSANCLTRLFFPAINGVIRCLNDNLTFSGEHLEPSKQEEQRINILNMVFFYDKLSTKLTDSFFDLKQHEVNQLLDSLIEKIIDDKFVREYHFFKQAYFSERGFFYVFVNPNNYDLIQTCRLKLNNFRPTYQKLIQLIEELITHANTIPEIIDFSCDLKEIVDTYFQSLLHTSLYKKEEEKIFKKLGLTLENKISDFKKNYLCDSEITGILNKILNIIAEFMPNFLISKEKRIGFFRKKITAKLSNEIENTIQSWKPSTP